MTSIDNGKPIKVTGPSEDEEFYISWGRETLKNNITLVNEVLRQLVSLNIALLGGSIVFLNDNLIDWAFKVAIILMFFSSLIFSFVGIMPRGGRVDLRVAEEIRRHKSRILKWKLYFVGTAGLLLGTGFILALIGLLAHRP
jgi:magnesium-transporting ATPase (P-type)